MTSRRGNNEGSIYRRKDGRWVGQYTIQTAKGPKLQYVYAKTRKEAAEKLTRAMADRDAGLVFEDKKLTLGQYLDRWLRDSVLGSVKPVTFENYEQLVRVHIVPALGRIKLKTLSPAHLQGFYRERLDSGLSTRTVQYLHALLHKALKQALRWDLVPRNVATAVDPPRVHREEMQPLSPTQVRTFLEAAREDRLEALYVLAVHCGLRQGELLGLRWEDIDLEAGTLQVRRTLTAAKGDRAFTTPKTVKSRRNVRLTSGAIDALIRHHQRQLEEREHLAGLWQDQGLVFTSGVGTPINRHNLLHRSFKPLLEKVGLPHSVRFHDLRHTCATLLLSKGIHPKLVQELLGHSNVSITLDTYSHILPGMGNQAANAMEDTLSSPTDAEGL